jgi:Ca-activated chloride channel family protein
MPGIGAFPKSVLGLGRVNVEIFVSTEKGTDDLGAIKTDSWLYHMAKEFNSQSMRVNERTVSVSIRPIASGTAADYIMTGEYMPDAFSPSNMLWGEMIASQGIEITLEEERLVGNTAGILINPSAYARLIEEHGQASLGVIIDAVIAGEITMGFTNPTASSTGLSCLVSILSEIDPADPTGEAASAKLAAFHGMLPAVSFTTTELVESALNSYLDCMAMAYQTSVFIDAFRDYVFIPVGARQDSPVYSIGKMPDEKRDALRLFIDFCKLPENQKAAKELYGFNCHDDYEGVGQQMGGDEIIEATKIWKATKDASKPIVAVFVCDLSVSLAGKPLDELKNALYNASSYINSSTYMGMVCYSTDVSIRLPIGMFSDRHKNMFLSAVGSFEAEGNAATFNALAVALKMIAEAREDTPDSKSAIILLSDGKSIKGRQYLTMKSLAPVIKGMGVPIFTISYNTSVPELEHIASEFNGSYVEADVGDIVYQLKSIFHAHL